MARERTALWREVRINRQECQQREIPTAEKCDCGVQPMTRRISCVETAKLIRASLKREFPGVPFSVRSKTYTGGSSIDVEYENGPAVDKVEKVAKQFEGATFNGMEDIKEYHKSMLNGEEVRFGADFVHVVRNLSQELRERIAQYLARCYGVEFRGMTDYPNVGRSSDDWHSTVWQYTWTRDFAEFFANNCLRTEVAA